MDWTFFVVDIVVLSLLCNVETYEYVDMLDIIVQFL